MMAARRTLTVPAFAPTARVAGIRGRERCGDQPHCGRHVHTTDRMGATELFQAEREQDITAPDFQVGA